MLFVQSSSNGFGTWDVSVQMAAAHRAPTANKPLLHLLGDQHFDALYIDALCLSMFRCRGLTVRVDF